MMEHFEEKNPADYSTYVSCGELGEAHTHIRHTLPLVCGAPVIYVIFLQTDSFKAHLTLRLPKRLLASRF